MRRIYIAGPMRGYEDSNYPAFNRAAARFRALGWVVANPAEIGSLFNHSSTIDPAEYIREDLHHLARCEAIALLSGWEASVGARCEVAVALTLGLRFFDAGTGMALSQPPARVTIAGGYDQEPGVPMTLDLVAHLIRQIAFSERTFGPGQRTNGVLDHIRKELLEIEQDPTNLVEWIDVVILALDGAWRAGHTPTTIAQALVLKQARNESRQWPDWRTVNPEQAIEHVREESGV